LIKHIPLSQLEQEIDVSNLKKGVYMLFLESEEIQMVEKLIKF